MNRLGWSAGDLPAKVGARWRLPGVTRTPSSAEPQVWPPSASFRLVSAEFILGIFPGCSGSVVMTMTGKWAPLVSVT